jgi:hypothetical protein
MSGGFLLPAFVIALDADLSSCDADAGVSDTNGDWKGDNGGQGTDRRRSEEPGHGGLLWSRTRQWEALTLPDVCAEVKE